MTSEEFKKIRLDAGLTQKQMGKILHKTERRIRQYEAGDKIPALVAEKIRATTAKSL